MIGSWFWTSDLAHCVFRRTLRLLIGRLVPLEGGWVF